MLKKETIQKHKIKKLIYPTCIKEPNLIPLVIVAVVLFVFFLFATHCQASEINKTRFINAIIGEAESEPAIGKLAVACAIRNRGTLKGVYGEKAPRVINKLYSSKIKAEAEKAFDASSVKGACEFISGADHWEGTAFKTPIWAKHMKETFRTKGQVFYAKR